MFPSYSTLKHSENSDGNLMRQNPSMPDFWPWYKKHRYLHQALWVQVQVQVQLWEENRQDINTVSIHTNLFIAWKVKNKRESEGNWCQPRFSDPDPVLANPFKDIKCCFVPKIQRPWFTKSKKESIFENI